MDASAVLTLSSEEFSSIQKMVYDNTGIFLSSSKQELVKRRFKKRLKALDIDSYGSYIKYVKDNHDKEIVNFCNAITTNLTSFFRENHHFEFMKNTGLGEIVKRNAPKGRKLRVWSSGCSTGQEAYCLAITLREAVPNIDSWDVRILATDLDEKCLAKAKGGVYPSSEFDKVPKNIVGKYFEDSEEKDEKTGKSLYKAGRVLHDMIAFNKLNLMEKPWPMKGDFDLIFCRNVFIYFDKPTQLELVKRYAKLQKPGSYLCIGHSENIDDPVAAGYKLIGQTLYMRL